MALQKFNAYGGLTVGNSVSVVDNSGNITGDNITITGVYSGNAANISSVNASNLVAGTVPAARMSGTYTINISGSATTAGTVTTADQPNITSVGNLTSLTSSGNIQGANLIATGGIFSNVSYNKVQNSITLNANSNITFTSGAIINATASANFTPNLQSFTCNSGNTTSVVLIVNQGATAYNPLANIGLNGTNTAVTWQGSTSAPTGNANKKDIITYSIANIGDTLTAFGQLVSFG